MKGDGGGLNKSDNQGTTLGPGRAYLCPSPPASVLPQSSTTPFSTPYRLTNARSCVGMYLCPEGISQRPSRLQPTATTRRVVVARFGSRKRWSIIYYNNIIYINILYTINNSFEIYCAQYPTARRTPSSIAVVVVVISDYTSLCGSILYSLAIHIIVDSQFQLTIEIRFFFFWPNAEHIHACIAICKCVLIVA